jgi:hypothetical protein
MNKQETIEEAAEKWVFETNGHKWSNNDDTAGDNYGSFMAGAKWMKEKLYSEEDMREAYFTAINSTAEGWNGEHAGNGSLSIEKTFNDGYEMFIEQYKNK